MERQTETERQTQRDRERWIDRERERDRDLLERIVGYTNYNHPKSCISVYI